MQMKAVRPNLNYARLKGWIAFPEPERRSSRMKEDNEDRRYMRHYMREYRRKNAEQYRIYHRNNMRLWRQRNSKPILETAN